MFIELIEPKLIDVYRVGGTGAPDLNRVKIRVDESGRVTPLTLNLTFKSDADALAFAETLLIALKKPLPAPAL
jgi:hypothetical protein